MELAESSVREIAPRGSNHIRRNFHLVPSRSVPVCVHTPKWPMWVCHSSRGCIVIFLPSINMICPPALPLRPSAPPHNLSFVLSFATFLAPLHGVPSSVPDHPILPRGGNSHGSLRRPPCMLWFFVARRENNMYPHSETRRINNQPTPPCEANHGHAQAAGLYPLLLKPRPHSQKPHFKFF